LEEHLARSRWLLMIAFFFFFANSWFSSAFSLDVGYIRETSKS